MEEKLVEIFKRRVGIDFYKQFENRDTPLFGSELNVPARELVLILLDIENEYNIRLPNEAVANGAFMTFNKIKGLIEI